MLLILEIGLTVWLCINLGKAKKGWAYGLLPLGICIAGGFLIGLILGALGIATAAAVTAIGLILDIATIIVLIVMLTKNKSPK